MNSETEKGVGTLQSELDLRALIRNSVIKFGSLSSSKLWAILVHTDINMAISSRMASMYYKNNIYINYE